jgi:hypothetical protein
MLSYLVRIREWSKKQKHIQLFWFMMSIVAMLLLVAIALNFTYSFTNEPIPNATFTAKINYRTTLVYSPHQDLYNLTLTYFPDSGDTAFVVKTGAARVGETSSRLTQGKTFTNLSYGTPISYTFWSSGRTQADQILRLTTISTADGAAYTETDEYIITTKGFSRTYEYIPTLSVEGYSLTEIPVEVVSHVA